MTPTSCVYTVALCTHNHADRLARTLADLPRMRMPEQPWELLIVDNASADSTPALLAGHAWPAGWTVRVVREARLGIANARNRALADACGEWLLFIDDDETLDPDWLCAYERLIASEAPDAFGGRIEVFFEDPRPAWLSDELLGFLGQLDYGAAALQLSQPSTPLFTGNFGVRLAVAHAIGGFDRTLGRLGNENSGGEDVDFYRRLLAAGYRIWWTPEAVIHHRIQVAKLNRGYFLDLHFRQGRMEGNRRRGAASRLPPRYLVGQLGRALLAVWRRWRAAGRDGTLRLEMNVAYFVGYIDGWLFGRAAASPPTP